MEKTVIVQSSIASHWCVMLFADGKQVDLYSKELV
jgi:hypothetical protein